MREMPLVTPIDGVAARLHAAIEFDPERIFIMRKPSGLFAAKRRKSLTMKSVSIASMISLRLAPQVGALAALRRLRGSFAESVFLTRAANQPPFAQSAIVCWSRLA